MQACMREVTFSVCEQQFTVQLPPKNKKNSEGVGKRNNAEQKKYILESRRRYAVAARVIVDKALFL